MQLKSYKDFKLWFFTDFLNQFIWLSDVCVTDMNDISYLIYDWENVLFPELFATTKNFFLSFWCTETNSDEFLTCFCPRRSLRIYDSGNTKSSNTTAI